MSLVKKFGPVERVHSRFMKMHHIAVVEFKDHESALRFKMAPGKHYMKHPSIGKFWRNMLKVSNGNIDAGHDTVPVQLTQPQVPKISVQEDSRNVSTTVSSISRSSTSQKSKVQESSHGQFEMHVPAVVPSLEETEPTDSTPSTHPCAPKRKPTLRLSSNPKRYSEPVQKDIEIIDLEAVSDDSELTPQHSGQPIIVLGDDEDAYTIELSNSANNLQKENEETVISSTAILPSCGSTSDSKHSVDVSTPVLTPAGLSLIPHSFKIMPPPGSEMLFLITGSLKPIERLDRTLILRGIPYELNVRSKLKPSLLSFGSCFVIGRYLGLRTTAFVRYSTHSEALACFSGAYKQLKLEYLKVFWMEKLPLPESTFGAPLTRGNEDVELEFAPGSFQMRKKVLKSLRQKMCGYRIQRKSYIKEKINRNYKWRTQPGENNAKLIQKNQVLMSNNIKSQKLILNRLESCEDPKTKLRLMGMLKKLEKTHLVTAANLKVLHSSAEPSNKPSSDPQPSCSKCKTQSEDLPPPNPYPKTIKITNFSDRDVLQKHFDTFGTCTVFSYVVEKSAVVLCKFEKRKEAVIAFVKGQEMTWVEWGNKKQKSLELEWDFSIPIEQ